MSNDQVDSQSGASEKKPWFTSNRGGFGMHPQTWQGVLVIVVAVAIIACVIILVKTLA